MLLRRRVRRLVDVRIQGSWIPRKALMRWSVQHAAPAVLANHHLTAQAARELSHPAQLSRRALLVCDVITAQASAYAARAHRPPASDTERAMGEALSALGITASVPVAVGQLARTVVQLADRTDTTDPQLGGRLVAAAALSLHGKEALRSWYALVPEQLISGDVEEAVRRHLSSLAAARIRTRQAVRQQRGRG
jgi:hypothetical protein